MNTNKSLTTCIIDDDMLYLFGMKKMLEVTRISTSVMEFNNGSDALEYFKRWHNHSELLPDIIFLDINMPVMDGWQFLQEYKSIKRLIEKEIQIFMVSSSINQSDMDKAVSTKMVKQYIIKPLSLQQLKELFIAN